MGGVYTITNKINNKIYIGCTKNFNVRKLQHLRNFKNNTHPNLYLRNAVKKHGIDNFIFEILMEYSEDSIGGAEHYWINMLNTTNKNYGYNICLINNLNYNYKRPVEIGEKISKAKFGKYKGKENKNFGKKYSQKRIDSMINGMTTKKKIYQYDIEENFIRSYKSIREASKLTKIDRSQISGICNNKKSYYTANGFKFKFN